MESLSTIEFNMNTNEFYDLLYGMAIYLTVSTAILLSFPHIMKLFFDPIRIEPTLPPITTPQDYSIGTGKSMKCYNPGTGELLGEINEYTNKDIKQVVSNANIAHNTYKHTSLAERKALLQLLLDYIVAHQNEIIRLSCECTGKSTTEAAVGEILTTCEKLRYYIANADVLLTRQYRSVPLLMRFTKQAYIEYTPLGVIGIIVPWNYPFHNVISHLATCIITGNAGVVKVSDYVSLTKLYFDKLLKPMLLQRNIPINLLQVVCGGAETGQALIEYCNKILFIGSAQVGKSVMSHASNTLTPVILELGGKDPFIICNDADMKQVISHALLGAFINCGQNCVSAERFYVQNDIYDEFIQKVLARIKSIRQGPPAISNIDTTNNNTRIESNNDIGAIVMKSQITKYKQYIDDAISKGARLLCGGDINDSVECANGYYFRLTVVADCTSDMLLVREEVFGMFI